MSCYLPPKKVSLGGGIVIAGFPALSLPPTGYVQPLNYGFLWLKGRRAALACACNIYSPVILSAQGFSAGKEGCFPPLLPFIDVDELFWS